MATSLTSRQEFASHVTDAYKHLYDLVHLRTHPLATFLGLDASLSPKERARRLHDLLRDLIDELDPGPAAPSFSTEWRRHRYMVLRYLKGLTHQQVADQLMVGLRQYYRVRKGILDEIADILWERRADRGSSGKKDRNAPPDRLALLRLESARMAQADRYARVDEVAGGVTALFQEVLDQRELDVDRQITASLPAVSVQQELLRQTLLGVVGYLVERSSHATIRWTAKTRGSRVCLSITVVPPQAVQGAAECDEQTLNRISDGVYNGNRDGRRLAELDEIALLSGCHILPICHRPAEDGTGYIVGFEVQVPTAQRTVLVIDDNQDVLELFRGYLGTHGYRAATAQTGQEGLDKARRLQPYAITLDLMMPGQDGWAVLQSLLAHPDTCEIPVIVCTVLKQRELALMLGATGYLEKPITERDLLAALAMLEQT